LSAKEFAHRFKTAVDIAQNSTERAVTHNKGIYNGVDAVVLATGNDFRAIEATGHAYASRNGYYSSLSHCSLDKGVFTLSLTIPLALGTVGGLTRLHPMAAKALEILQHPSAPELMSIAASAGLANNFSAVASLVTTGIQKGHMKLHLSNILNLLDATDKQKEAARSHFRNLTVSVQAVKEFIDSNAKL
jgi:hydroxymethylglutaryl-CoA reductase